MTRDELLVALRRLEGLDPEYAHGEADELLLRFIADLEVREAFERIERWYS